MENNFQPKNFRHALPHALPPPYAQKRGGSMGYGGIYSPVSHEGHGSSGPPDYHDYHDYDEGRSSNYNPQQQVQQGHPHGQHQDHFDYYDDDYNEDHGRNSEGNYLQGYDYNSQPYYYDYDLTGRQSPTGGRGGSAYNDYQDFNTYDPYTYYSNSHQGRDGQAFDNYGYKDVGNHEGQKNFYYKK